MTVFLLVWTASVVGVVWTTYTLDPKAPWRETWLLALVPGMNTLLLLCALMLMAIQATHRRAGPVE